jgi:hypothetical protein
MTIQIDVWSKAVILIQAYFGGTYLARGTGFTWRSDDGRLFLVTVWHNITGRHPFTKHHISPAAAEPNFLECRFRAKQKVPGRVYFEHQVLRLHLFNESGEPNWFVHPRYGSDVDIAAIWFDPAAPMEGYPINKLQSMPLKTLIGQDAFILGYPYEANEDENFVGFPIWKRASIASEPMLFASGRRYTLYDSASRPGMSGAPIIRREWSHWENEDGSLHVGRGEGTRLIGIYSGRLHKVGKSDADLAIGWPIRLVEETIAGGRRDKREDWRPST